MKIFLFLIPVFLMANNSFANDIAFSCGDWPSYFDVKIENGKFLAGQRTQGFIPRPVDFKPIKISAEQSENACSFSIKQKSKNIKIDFDMNEGFSSAKVSGLKLDSVDSQKIKCNSEEHDELLSHCQVSETEPPHKKVASKGVRIVKKIDLYSCKYIVPPKNISVEDVDIHMASQISGNRVCLGKIKCEWKGSPGIKQDKNWPKLFEDSVVCLPSAKGSCSSSVTNCGNDTNVAFNKADQGSDKSRRDLNIHPARGSR